MKKIITLILSLVMTSPLLGQWEKSQKLGLKTGYEWNVFLNPSTLERNGDLLNRSELWDNATYQSIFLNNTFKKEFTSGRLRLDFDLSGGLYQTNLKANRYSFEIGASYRTKYSKRKYFEFAPNLTRVKRDGINQADAILSTPFSYLQMVVPVHFDFYLGNKAWLKTEAGYIYKIYDRQNGEKLFYHAPFAGASLSKKWETEKLVKKLTFSTIVQMRRYTDVDQASQSDSDDEELLEGELVSKTRAWNYFKNSLEYSMTETNKRYALTFGLYHVSRIDLDESNSYHEISPGIKMEYRLGKIKLGGALKYSLRNYPELTPGEENDENPLRYNYLRGNIKVETLLKKGTNIFIKGNLINRTSSNVDVMMRGFRGYFNSFIETGISIRL